MAAFDPKLIGAATQDADANKRTTKQVVLANISKMLAQAKDPAVEGKRNFKVEGETTKFSIRVSNTPLDLEVFVDGKPATTKEASVPTKVFVEALGYFKGRVEAGAYDEQLKALDGKRSDRTAKMRQTRQSKKADQPAK